MLELFKIAEVQKRFENGFDFVDVKTDNKIIRFYKEEKTYQANNGIAPNCVLGSGFIKEFNVLYSIYDRSLHSIGKHPKEERIFSEAVRPLMKYLAENHHPHTTCIVQNNKVELVEGLMTYHTEDYILD